MNALIHHVARTALAQHWFANLCAWNPCGFLNSSCNLQSSVSRLFVNLAEIANINVLPMVCTCIYASDVVAAVVTHESVNKECQAEWAFTRHIIVALHDLGFGKCFPILIQHCPGASKDLVRRPLEALEILFHGMSIAGA